MLWRIYYADNSTFSNLDGKPEDAPPVGVICILQNPPNHGWMLLRDKDYYLRLDDSEWVGCEADGFWQYMFKPGWKCPKFGENVSDDVYAKVIAQATEDMDKGLKGTL